MNADADAHARTASLDAVIIGGGAAGLSAGLVLGRARRRVLILDAGDPRNRVAPHMHGVLGHDGLPPLELLARGRAEVAGYGVEVRGATAVRAARLADGHFEVETADGATVTARRLVVATGLRDVLPPIRGLDALWGTDAVACPYCDGWEARDLAIGVIAIGPGSLHQALLLTQWSRLVSVLQSDLLEASDDDLRALAARGVRLEPRTIAQVARIDGGVDVTFDDGSVERVDRLFAGGQLQPRAELLTQLGAETVETPRGTNVAVDPTGRTSVDGVWAVGNVADLSALVPIAIAEGVAAATAINADLVLADIAADIAADVAADTVTAVEEHQHAS